MEVALTPADDDFHPPSDDSWWFHETCWFWFFVPERRLGGWLYNWIRPNIGVSGGGCWVWDDTTFLHWEVPYYSCHANLKVPADRDLRDFRFPSGVTVKMIEPLRRYRLTYTHDEMIDLNLEYAAVMDPWVSSSGEPDPRPNHLDQVGRVTGSLRLHGEEIAVDCLAIRDRTWTIRSERWKYGGGYGYTNAAASAALAFLAVGDAERVGGYLLCDGDRSELVTGARRVERDPDHGFVTRVVVEAADAAGRSLEAEGTSVSRMAMPIPGVHGIVWTSLVDWAINGVPAWGEDQEPWPIMTWSNSRRADGVRAP